METETDEQPKIVTYKSPPTSIQALKAVLVFHAGGPFDSTEWTMLTGAADATTKGLCDMIRGVLEREAVNA